MRRLFGLLVATAVILTGAACEEIPSSRPGPDNTGPLNSCNRTISSTVAANELKVGDVSDVCVNGQLTLTTAMNGHKLSNFTLNGNGGSYGVRADASGLLGITFEDGKIYNMRSTGIYGRGWTARRLEVTESGGDAFKPRDNTRIEASWGHHNGAAAGSHSDFIQFDGPKGSKISNVTIVGNHCDQPASQRNETSPVWGVRYNTNACIQLNGEISLSNVQATGNWMVGGNYTLNCGAPGKSQIVLSGNTYLPGAKYGNAAGCPAK